MKAILRSLAAAGAILLVFAGGVWLVSDWTAAAGRQALQHELEQAAAHCFAAEGRYPPDLAYIERHYGVRCTGRRYTVDYRRTAPDRAPIILVQRAEGGALA